MPDESNLSFQYWHEQLFSPYVIYADLEALTTKIEGPELGPN